MVESATSASCSLGYPVTMRTSPTITLNSVKFYSTASGPITTTISQNRSSPNNGALLLNISSATAGQACTLYAESSSSAYITYYAEL